MRTEFVGTEHCEWCEQPTLQGCEACNSAVCRECAQVDPVNDTFLCPQHAKEIL